MTTCAILVYGKDYPDIPRYMSYGFVPVQFMSYTVSTIQTVLAIYLLNAFLNMRVVFQFLIHSTL